MTLVNPLPAKMDIAPGASGIPHGDTLYMADLQVHANPEEVSLEVTLAETPDQENKDSLSSVILDKRDTVRNHVKEGTTPQQSGPSWTVKRPTVPYWGISTAL